MATYGRFGMFPRAGAAWWVPTRRFGLGSGTRDASFVYSPNGTEHVVYIEDGMLHVKDVHGNYGKSEDGKEIAPRLCGRYILSQSGSFVAFTMREDEGARVCVWNPFNGMENSSKNETLRMNKFRAVFPGGRYMSVSGDRRVICNISGDIVHTIGSGHINSQCGHAYGYGGSWAWHRVDDFHIEYTDGRNAVDIPLRDIYELPFNRPEFHREKKNIQNIWIGETGDFVYASHYNSNFFDSVDIVKHRANGTDEVIATNISPDDKASLSPDASYIVGMEKIDWNEYKMTLRDLHGGWSMPISHDVHDRASVWRKVQWSKQSASFILSYMGRVCVFAKIHWSTHRNEFPPAVKQEAVWQMKLLHRRGTEHPLGDATGDFIMQHAVDTTPINELTTQEDVDRLSSLNALRKLQEAEHAAIIDDPDMTAMMNIAKYIGKTVSSYHRVFSKPAVSDFPCGGSYWVPTNGVVVITRHTERWHGAIVEEYARVEVVFEVEKLPKQTRRCLKFTKVNGEEFMEVRCSIVNKWTFVASSDPQHISYDMSTMSRKFNVQFIGDATTAICP